MHELPVAESILEIALRHGREAGAARITDLHLVIGDLATVVDDAIQFYWDILSRGSLAEGATLHFRRLRAQWMCLDCGERSMHQEGRLGCPHCDGRRLRAVSGTEFYLEAIEIEDCAAVSDR